MSKKIQRQLLAAIKKVNDEMGGHGNGMYARGLSSEGYAGGYAQALNDVINLLNGVTPNTRNYWAEDQSVDHTK